MFSGKEKTYQAWYGVSEADLKTNRTINYAGMERPGEPYDNETDNYKQDHYQLFFNQELTSRLKFSAGLFYIKGKGYYEQYKADQAYADYGLPEPIYGTDTITNTDLVRQLWLDNDFYGSIFPCNTKLIIHNSLLAADGTATKAITMAMLIWAEKGLALPGRWYDLDANKNDLDSLF